MQNDDFIDENLDNAGSASDNNTVHKNLDLDVVLAEITAFAENMHTKNQHKKKICLRCMMIIPLVFMVLMFTMDTAKVVYLLLWVISLFIFCAYLIIIDYIDDKLARKLNDLNIEIQEKQADASITDSIKAFLSESSKVFVLSSVVLIFTEISLTPRSICVIPLMLSPVLLILEARLLTAFLTDDSRRFTLVLITVCIIT